MFWAFPWSPLRAAHRASYSEFAIHLRRLDGNVGEKKRRLWSYVLLQQTMANPTSPPFAVAPCVRLLRSVAVIPKLGQWR